MAKRSSTFGSIMRKRLSDITNSQSQLKVSGQEEKRSPPNNLSAEDYIDQLLKVWFSLGLRHFLQPCSLNCEPGWLTEVIWCHTFDQENAALMKLLAERQYPMIVVWLLKKAHKTKPNLSIMLLFVLVWGKAFHFSGNCNNIKQKTQNSFLVSFLPVSQKPKEGLEFSLILDGQENHRIKWSWAAETANQLSETATAELEPCSIKQPDVSGLSVPLFSTVMA